MQTSNTAELSKVIKALPKEEKIKILKRLQAGELTIAEAIHTLQFRLDGMVIIQTNSKGEFILYSVNNILYSKDEFYRMLELTGQTLEGCLQMIFGVWKGFEFGWTSRVFTWFSEETKQKYYYE